MPDDYANQMPQRDPLNTLYLKTVPSNASERSIKQSSVKNLVLLTDYSAINRHEDIYNKTKY